MISKCNRKLLLMLIAGFALPLLLGFRFVLFSPRPNPYTDVTDAPYNAIPNDGQDDSAAFQLALDDLKATGGGSLYIPDGGYRFDALVAVTNGEWGLTIRGESTAVRLYGNNPDGIFRLTHTSRKEEITIRDLSLIANYPGAGTAIEVTSPAGGANDKRILTADNLHIRYAGETNYFNKGIIATGIYRPLISNCTFRGPIDPEDMSDTSLSFRADIGFDVSDCYAPVVEGCLATGVGTAYYVVTATNSLPEDGAFRYCTADYCKTGVKFHLGSVAREPTLWVTGCDLKARDYGAWVYGRRILHITGNTFSQLSEEHALRDIQLDNCHLGVVLDNTFFGSLAGGRKNIVVDSDGLDLLFAENTYSGVVGDAVQTDLGAVDVFIY